MYVFCGCFLLSGMHFIATFPGNWMPLVGMLMRNDCEYRRRYWSILATSYVFPGVGLLAFRVRVRTRLNITLSKNGTMLRGQENFAFAICVLAFTCVHLRSFAFHQRSFAFL
ncbi:hypothetical protein EV421DRAFT_1744179 [Armillaria borealis]|uniref:Uncharacterized protein n=1 Tax=Armillaria borealis TaxID=47425 RepID=A0AA39MD18_9AGAR|nr:hypothetical protein EV421DRAFT_1744179 [Armillaria borealis]